LEILPAAIAASSGDPQDVGTANESAPPNLHRLQRALGREGTTGALTHAQEVRGFDDREEQFGLTGKGSIVISVHD